MNTSATVSDHQQTWTSYTLAWQAQSAADRQALLARSLHPECRYADPLADVIGWPALSAYMHDLQQQIPGVHFVTTRFISHHRCSIAQWQMRDAHEAVLSEGMSFGEYEADGRLIRMNGFFDTPARRLTVQYLEQVQRGIDFIEARLDQEEVSFDAIAQAAGLSAWHFQRIFKAITHETLKGYIRSRRLAHACASLVGTKRRILDIALLAGYDSQESFTRAFKHLHGMTPGEFRRARTLRQEHKKVSIDTAYLSHLQTGVVTEPVFRHWPARRYVGLQTSFYGVCSDKNDLAMRIPPLWEAFLRRLPEVARPVPGVCYGLVDQDPQDAERLSYCSAIEIDAIERIPDGMRVVTIEPQTYAVFRHVGAPEQLDNTVNYIYSNWLHTAGWRHTQSADIECYGPEYLPGTDTCVTEYAIPVSR